MMQAVVTRTYQQPNWKVEEIEHITALLKAGGLERPIRAELKRTLRCLEASVETQG